MKTLDPVRTMSTPPIRTPQDPRLAYLRILLLLAVLVPQPLLAQTGNLVTFQGRLSNADGTPMADGAYTVNFRVYESDTGDAVLWEEEHAVDVRDGIFSVLLGLSAPLPIYDLDEPPVLAVIVDDRELTPRLPMSAVPYALQAHRMSRDALAAGENVSIVRREDGVLEIAAAASGNGELSHVERDLTLTGDGTPGAPLGLADGGISSRHLGEHAVEGANIAEGALVAGENVTITRQASGEFAIAAAGGGGGLAQVDRDATLSGNGTMSAPLGLADDAVSTQKIEDQAVSGAKLSDGALVAGQNVTITRQGSGSLEIASVAAGGLTSVTSDATLAGDGTSAAPLALSLPLSLNGSVDEGVVQVKHQSGPTAQLGNSSAAVVGFRPGGATGNIGGVFGAYGGHTGTGHFGYLGGLEYGGYGEHANGHFGALGASGYGAYAEHANGNVGYLGQNHFGAYGRHAGTGNFGYVGSSVFGVYGRNQNAGNYGYLGYTDYGVYGMHTRSGNSGYLGSSEYAVYGTHGNSGNAGYLGSGAYGAYGEYGNGNYGILGQSNVGVYGRHGGTGNFAYLAGNLYGVFGQNQTSGNSGHLGGNSYAVYGSSSTGHAGYFDGDVHVSGTLSKGGGSFKIDHPLDPANQYLSHSFVESPDMMNIYNGMVTTNAEGYATVALPAYFEALNRDFRYQLTVIGVFAQAIVAEEIEGNQFVVRTNHPHVDVSWQVTGIRHDPWAEAHRIVVEEEKSAAERDKRLYPELDHWSDTPTIGSDDSTRGL